MWELFGSETLALGAKPAQAHPEDDAQDWRHQGAIDGAADRAPSHFVPHLPRDPGRSRGRLEPYCDVPEAGKDGWIPNLERKGLRRLPMGDSLPMGASVQEGDHALRIRSSPWRRYVQASDAKEPLRPACEVRETGPDHVGRRAEVRRDAQRSDHGVPPCRRIPDGDRRCSEPFYPRTAPQDGLRCRPLAKQPPSVA